MKNRGRRQCLVQVAGSDRCSHDRKRLLFLAPTSCEGIGLKSGLKVPCSPSHNLASVSNRGSDYSRHGNSPNNKLRSQSSSQEILKLPGVREQPSSPAHTRRRFAGPRERPDRHCSPAPSREKAPGSCVNYPLGLVS